MAPSTLGMEEELALGSVFPEEKSPWHKAMEKVSTHTTLPGQQWCLPPAGAPLGQETC